MQIDATRRAATRLSDLRISPLISSLVIKKFLILTFYTQYNSLQCRVIFFEVFKTYRTYETPSRMDTLAVVTR